MRIDKLQGFERHSIRGQPKMQVCMGLGLVVMLAMALGRLEAGEPEQQRTMTLPVCRAAVAIGWAVFRAANRDRIDSWSLRLAPRVRIDVAGLTLLRRLATTCRKPSN